MAATRSSEPRLLLVEGADDEHVIKHIYEQVVRPLDFDIEQMSGVDQVAEEVDAHAKVRDRTALGVVVDANSDTGARWHSIRDGLARAGIEAPPQLPTGGALIEPTRRGQPTVGVWLMPDNESGGEVEDFVAGLISDDDVVWPLARDYIDRIPDEERPPKVSKAQVHAWLAARAEGAPMGGAIGQGKFDLECDAAQEFSAWLRGVFG